MWYVLNNGFRVHIEYEVEYKGDIYTMVYSVQKPNKNTNAQYISISSELGDLFNLAGSSVRASEDLKTILEREVYDHIIKLKSVTFSIGTEKTSPFIALEQLEEGNEKVKQFGVVDPTPRPKPVSSPDVRTIPAVRIKEEPTGDELENYLASVHAKYFQGL
jgi:hypothetical protein